MPKKADSVTEAAKIELSLRIGSERFRHEPGQFGCMECDLLLPDGRCRLVEESDGDGFDVFAICGQLGGHFKKEE